MCGRLPELKVVNPKSHNKWEVYSNMADKPSIVYLAEAECGTCQSNAGIAGQLAKRWEMFGNHKRREHLSVLLNIFVFNRDRQSSRKKFGMMRRAMTNRYNVSDYVSLNQDNSDSDVWDTLGDFMTEDGGKFYNETVPFKSKKNDMYLVDQWGRVMRFLRDAILVRTRVSGAESNVHWRDVIHNVMIKTKERKTVCDELQYEHLFCRVADEWELNGRHFRNLRAGTSLTIVIFIRADMEEFTTNGILRDVIDLSKRWSSPSYVVIVDSAPMSKTSFSTVNLYKQTQNADITLLLDEGNKVTSQYYAAPGDVVAHDYLGRIIGFYNRVNLQDETIVDQLKALHLNWNPTCESFLYTQQASQPTGTTPTPQSLFFDTWT